MNKFFSLMMYVLWSLSLIGLLTVTFSTFRYPDLNVIVLVLFIFTLLNTYFVVNKK